MDGLISIFDLQTQQLRHKLTGHFKPVRSIAFTPGARGTGDDAWPAIGAPRSHKHALLAPSTCSQPPTFPHTDSQLLLSACDDMHVHLHEANGNLVEAFSGHESWVLSVAAHADNTHFATGSSDGSVKLWDISQRACIMTATEHKDQVWSVAFNGDGSQLVSCGDDGVVATYHAQ